MCGFILIVVGCWGIGKILDTSDFSTYRIIISYLLCVRKSTGKYVEMVTFVSD